VRDTRQRNILADQYDVFAFGRQVQCTGKDPRVVGVGPESDRQDCRIGVIELDLQCATVCSDRNRLVETPVRDTEIVEHAQGFPREPSELMMMAFTLQFADDHQRKDHIVLGETNDCPRVRQQHRGIEHECPERGGNGA
jgi:hypothetical protein